MEKTENNACLVNWDVEKPEGKWEYGYEGVGVCMGSTTGEQRTEGIMSHGRDREERDRIMEAWRELGWMKEAWENQGCGGAG
jgi:sugar phosphate isomerase/epimerase